MKQEMSGGYDGEITLEVSDMRDGDEIIIHTEYGVARLLMRGYGNKRLCLSIADKYEGLEPHSEAAVLLPQK